MLKNNNLGKNDMRFKFDLDQLIRFSLAEDIGEGDITGNAACSEPQPVIARLITRQNGIIAGSAVVEHVFMQHDPQLFVKIDHKDGDLVDANETIFVIEGDVKSILAAERVALNFLAHLSGIATLTYKYVTMVEHTQAKITDTRKTTPLLRALEKDAVRAGGGVNHRFGLFDMVLLKENHIRAAGGIKKAVDQTNDYLKKSNIDSKIEVETTDLEEVHEALSCSIDRIMLDNMTVEEIREAVNLINHQVEVEASGGITQETIVEIAETGVDFISIGALTHSAPAFDFSILIEKV
jgi:nicotinate-nucleotide pyrophosphorylase (carboxylating)